MAKCEARWSQQVVQAEVEGGPKQCSQPRSNPPAQSTTATPSLHPQPTLSSSKSLRKCKWCWECWFSMLMIRIWCLFFFFPSYQAWGWLEEESKASSERFAHENFSKSTSNTFVCLLKYPLNQSLSLIYRMWRRPRETSLRITAWNGNCLWASLKWAGRNRHLYR